MPAPISVVIPTLNAESALPGCAAALYEGLNSGLIREVIISDGGSQDQTAALADELGTVLVTGPASRGGQLGRGCDAAKGDWVLVLHADTQLDPGWSEIAARHMTTAMGDANTAAYFNLAFDKKGAGAAWTSAWANLRSRLFNLPYGDQGLLIRRQELIKAGGYRDIPLMEDVDLTRRLPAMTRLPAIARTSAAKYVQEGWLRQGAKNLALLLRFLSGADPSALAQAYRRSSRRS